MKQCTSMLKPSLMVAMLALVIAPVASVAQTAEEGLFTAGVVLSIDENQRVITIEEASYEGTQFRFTLGENTEILKDGQSISLGDIAIGDPVSIDYQESSGANDARSVEVLTTPGPETATSPSSR